ncbi:MAG: GLUG motif-containing protein, partial [Paludibacteraceae bacterium]
MTKTITQFKRLAATLMFVAAMVMPSTAWAQNTINPSKPQTGDGSSASPYQIGTAAELYWFAGLVNGTLTDGTSQNTAACAVLTDDIKVNDDDFSEFFSDDPINAEYRLTSYQNSWVIWTPIGKHGNNAYTGTFDGDNHTISGLLYDTKESGYNNSEYDQQNKGQCAFGLFGYNKGTIKNVGVINSYFRWDYGNAGGVCGHNDSGTITNSYNQGKVVGVPDDDGGGYGGVCGSNNNGGTIENCYNTGSVSGRNNVGGVCGSNNNGATIKNSYNTGSVSGTYDVGGVCGYNTGSITNCYNTGSVSGSGDTVGGVCGWNASSIGIANCYNIGVVRDGEGRGVCGFTTPEAIANCYYLSGTATCAIGSGSGSVDVKTADEFKSGAVAWLLAQGCTINRIPCSGSAWGQQIGTEDYPVCGGAKVYQGTPCTGVYSNTEGATGEHNYVNGICNRCGAYQPAVETKGKYDFDGDSETEDVVYEISNAGQLYWFADKVNNDNENFGSANAILTDNITVNDGVLDAKGNLVSDTSGFRSWTPIGGYYNSTNVNYTGTFDGNNYSISGLYYNEEITNDELILFTGGLFGRNFGTIKNVNIKDSYFGMEFDGQYYVLGAISGFNCGTIENCYNAGAVSLSGTVSDGFGTIGGICGYNGGAGIIKNCNNAGKVSSTIDSPNAYVGGLCGINYYTIESCSNAGEVSGIYKVGGVCGDNEENIKNSFNEGKVSGTEYVGGVSGFNTSLTGGGKVEITNCYNTGEVIGTGYGVGGVSGYNEGAEYGETSTITNCYNTGDVSGASGVGGIIGGNYRSSPLEVSNCYYLDTTKSDSRATSKTEAEFASGEVCYLLNGSSSTNPVWYQNIDLEDAAADAYPLLDSGHGTVYRCTPCTGVYSNAAAREHVLPDEYDNGFKKCSVCGAIIYEPAKPVSENHHSELNDAYSGYYAIENAGQLYWFAALVSGALDDVERNKSANAVLTADIVVNSGLEDKDGLLDSLEYDEETGKVTNGESFISWTRIGLFMIGGYSGIFDGNDKTISGLYFDDSNTSFVGLFGHLKGTVKNVGVVDSYFNGNSAVGGVCGYNDGGTIQNCYNTATVKGTSYVGGLCGNNGTGTITNCYNTGAVSGTSTVGGLCGINSGTITNCYYLDSEETDSFDGTTFKTEDEFASGEVCYLLNGSSPYGAWGQTLSGTGKQDYPILGGIPVYYRDEVYTNTCGTLIEGTQIITASSSPLIWYEFTPTES